VTKLHDLEPSRQRFRNSGTSFRTFLKSPTPAPLRHPEAVNAIDPDGISASHQPKPRSHAEHRRAKGAKKMSLTLNTNNFSINAQRSVAITQSSLGLSMARLSSGLRVNSAKDDAAGLAVASNMMTQAKGMDVAIRNANDGISLLQVADGAQASMGDILQRMRELVVQAKSGTYTSTDIEKLDVEYQQLVTELGDIQGRARFNGVDILSATGAGPFELQVGANASDTLTISTVNISLGSFAADLTALDATTFGTELDDIDAVLNEVNTARANNGAFMSRLDNVIVNLRNGYEAQMASYGRIMDADFARETANLSRAQVLQQAGVAMVAQANALPQNVLALLR
jgi:flagellin